MPANRFTFPGRPAEWHFEATPFLQWRNRAGLAPASPLCPSWAPQTALTLTCGSLAHKNFARRRLSFLAELRYTSHEHPQRGSGNRRRQ
jgi:hypothetical protein